MIILIAQQIKEKVRVTQSFTDLLKKKLTRKKGDERMRCPEHPEVWLYENMMEIEGYCTECHKWYNLRKLEEKQCQNR